MKFLCWLGHPHRLVNTKNCDIKKFENDEEAITVFECKHCGTIVGGYTRYVNTRFKSNEDIKSKTINIQKVETFDNRKFIK